MTTAFEQHGEVVALRPPAGSIASPQDALDLMMKVHYDTGSRSMALPASALDPAFFDLKSGLAGEILQKAVNYRIRLAIWGDYTRYVSQALTAFMAESNRGQQVAFVADEQEAIKCLAQGRA